MRVQVRAKEDRAKLLKRAAFISREVRRFWDKCSAVLDYCDRQEVEARKRELLDSELDSFVGQSEQFARLLVARKDGSAAGAGAADAETETDGDDDAQDDGDDDLASLQSEKCTGESDGESDEFDGAMEVDDDDDDEATLAAEEAAAAVETGAFVNETGAFCLFCGCDAGIVTGAAPSSDCVPAANFSVLVTFTTEMRINHTTARHPPRSFSPPILQPAQHLSACKQASWHHQACAHRYSTLHIVLQASKYKDHADELKGEAEEDLDAFLLRTYGIARGDGGATGASGACPAAHDGRATAGDDARAGPSASAAGASSTVRAQAEQDEPRIAAYAGSDDDASSSRDGADAGAGSASAASAAGSDGNAAGSSGDGEGGDESASLSEEEPDDERTLEEEEAAMAAEGDGQVCN